MDALKKWTAYFVQIPTWISILVGGALLAWQFTWGSIPVAVQSTVFALALFLTGIPHGALDHLVEEETAKRARKPFTMPLFLLKYIGIMLFYGIFWYALPSASLLFFLLISAWHFGETDIEKAPNTFLWNITRFVFGSFVLLFLLLTNVEETTPVLARITQSDPLVLSVWAFLETNKVAVLTVVISVFVVAFSVSFKQQTLPINKGRYARLALLLSMIAFLPLLPAFALYFGGWHALSSFDTIQTYLGVSKTDAQSGKRFGVALKIWSKTLLFTFLAFASLAFGIWYWLHFLQSFDPLPLLFIFLSLITLPHLNVMRKMNSRAA